MNRKIENQKLKIKDRQENDFLDPGEVTLYSSAGGRLGLKIQTARESGEEELIYEEVQPVLLFPFTYPSRFICLKDKQGKEIGIIKDMKDLSREGKNLLEQELGRRYLIPLIKDIIYIKEEFGNYRWEVVTDRGRKDFYVKGRSENLSFVNEWHIVVTDIEDCRYQIRDWRRLPHRARMELEKVI